MPTAVVSRSPDAPPPAAPNAGEAAPRCPECGEIPAKLPDAAPLRRRIRRVSWGTAAGLLLVMVVGATAALLDRPRGLHVATPNAAAALAGALYREAQHTARPLPPDFPVGLLAQDFRMLDRDAQLVVRGYVPDPSTGGYAPAHTERLGRVGDLLDDPATGLAALDAAAKRRAALVPNYALVAITTEPGLFLNAPTSTVALGLLHTITFEAPPMGWPAPGDLQTLENDVRMGLPGLTVNRADPARGRRTLIVVSWLAPLGALLISVAGGFITAAIARRMWGYRAAARLSRGRCPTCGYELARTTEAAGFR